MQKQTFRAQVGARTFEIVLEGSQLLLDGEPVPYMFEAFSDASYTLIVDGRPFPLVIETEAGGRAHVTLGGRRVEVQVKDERAILMERFGLAEAESGALREVHAPMPGLVLRVLVTPGQAVASGDGLVVLEAMKMENELRAQAAGVVKAIHVTAGDAVSKNALLLEFE